MWIPRNATTKVELVIGIFVSILSFVLIHAAFIAGHEYINEATPESGFYALDRNMEKAEKRIARFQGDAMLTEKYVQLGAERIQELEHILSDDHEMEMETVDKLLSDAFTSLQDAQELMKEYVGTEKDDIQKFALALLVESTANDIIRRLTQAKEHIEEPFNKRFETTIVGLKLIAENSVAVTKDFEVEEEVAETIRTTVRQQVQQIQSEPVQQEPICASKNQACTSTRDCCPNSGLTCTPVLTSKALPEKRCIAW